MNGKLNELECIRNLLKSFESGEKLHSVIEAIFNSTSWDEDFDNFNKLKSDKEKDEFALYSVTALEYIKDREDISYDFCKKMCSMIFKDHLPKNYSLEYLLTELDDEADIECFEIFEEKFTKKLKVILGCS